MAHCDPVSGFYVDMDPLLDTLASTLGYQTKQYAVVVDAGSTGSRVLAYEFHKAVSRKCFILYPNKGLLDFNCLSVFS